MSHTPPPASPQSLSFLQSLGKSGVVEQSVPSGSFVRTLQNLPVGQSAGSSQPRIHPPGHCVDPEGLVEKLR
jgi:hypothetical protein